MLGGSPGPQRAQLPTPKRPEFLAQAVYDTVALMERIRAERESKCPPLPGLSGITSRTLREAGDGYVDERTRDDAFRKEGGKAWVLQVVRQVQREMGGLTLDKFAPPDGNEAVRDYRRRLLEQGLSHKTVSDRLWALRNILAWAAEQSWIAAPPHFPKAARGKEGARRIVYDWIDAQTFRRLRSEIYGTPAERGALHGALKRHGVKMDADDLIERRRLYLSFGFYAGFHTTDLDSLDDSWVSLARGLYLRHNEKSSRTVADAMIEMPGPLRIDVATEIVRRKLDAFPRGDLIAGGRWSTVARVLSQTAARLGIGVHVNPRVLRRSTVRELALRGYTESETTAIMGHADSKMVREVYRDPALAVPHVRTRWDSDAYPEQPERLPAAVLRIDRAAR